MKDVGKMKCFVERKKYVGNREWEYEVWLGWENGPKVHVANAVASNKHEALAKAISYYQDKYSKLWLEAENEKADYFSRELLLWILSIAVFLSLVHGWNDFAVLATGLFSMLYGLEFIIKLTMS